MTMKKRLARYLERHYNTYSESTVQEMIDEAVVRLSHTDYLDLEALLESVESMRSEGWSNQKILAQLNIIDLEDRI